ncbi:phosphodiesterase [Thermoproteus uzoniensis 768-20]|uniref:Phosphoesterase n=1 Tax=Thermoproteus uzoniensis (strain 768-20) TaxID=999630 RepID=F2L1P3_THEU7|nr:metallophosphoesterase [Thermoproteus uzoniensis]AEA12899.1 phosphodiesterase [Thermoproteus uzoniensis 768-20]
MLVGVVSDSHDNVDAIRRAARLFKDRGVELVIHAGDWVAPFSAKALREALGDGVRVVGVWGNNEGELLYFQKVASQFGVEILGYAGVVEADGRRIGVYHGTSDLLTEAMIRSGMFDVVVYGHTHRVDVRRVGRTLVVNPGELCGYLTGRRTAAVLDTAGLEAEVVDV